MTKQKVAIVTGGSSGIGLAIVKQLTAQHFEVHNLDISSSNIGIFHHCDMTNSSEISETITQISAKHEIDVLVCNAGIHLSGTIEETDDNTFEHIFSLNVKGAITSIKHVLPSMKAQQKGAIVLIASDQAIIGKRNSFAYNLTKHALASIAKTTALDYASDNITVNALCPGTIETPLYHQAIDRYCQQSGENKEKVHQEESALQPLGRLGQPEEVASYVAFLVSDNGRFITGSLPVIDGGYTAQ